MLLTELIKVKHLEAVIPHGDLYGKVRWSMTPKEILEKKVFEKPLIIHPKEFTSYELLVQYKDDIKNLKLVPIKEDKMHTDYNSSDKEALVKGIEEYLSDTPMVLAVNLYPYWLSEDVDQRILWIKPEVQDEEVVEFISKSMTLLGTNEAVLFERPMGIKSLLIKGTVPHFRHVHVWIKKTIS